ncbi:GNAT family N-acetyltransferase [Nonomuraea sp. NPDC050556]|uniref:GNAT family N-acetyltransferase n=1 Tax=Nonomuraea sp. NPDC050556 TaxID=3364369 RepID=UPI00378AAB4A
MFTVYSALPEHGDVLGEIHAESWRAAYAGFFDQEFFDTALHRRRTRWHAVLAEGRDIVMLGAVDGRPLAFSSMGPSPSHPGSAEIFGFYGHPDGWGSGVAKVLIAASLDALRQRGFTHAHLWTLRDTPQSRRFYLKTGFAESGAVRGFDYGDGRLVDQVEYETFL